MTNNWHALQLLHIWDYTKTWALRTFKPWVVDCLESLHKVYREPIPWSELTIETA